MSRFWLIAVCIVVGLSIATADAAVSTTRGFPLGNSGWRILGPTYYDLGISIDGEGETSGIKWVAITISKNFRIGPDPFTGLFPSIELDFMQMDGVADDDLATRIIIQSEAINNSTGRDWTDYHWTLFGHGIARFNRDMTNVTTNFLENGWLIDPFVEHAWDYDDNSDVEELSVWHGVVPPGGVFIPGTGSGSLVIDVDLDVPNRPAPAIFKFLQAPTPEPTTICLLGLGSLAIFRKRRRA